MPSKRLTTRHALIGIMLAVLAWGVFHALGAMQLNGNPWRAVVVLTCSIGFIGFWWLMLTIRDEAGGRREKP